MEDGSGFAKRLTRDGFSLQTLEATELFEDFGDGSSSAFPDELLLSRLRLFEDVIDVDVDVGVDVVAVADDDGVGGGVGETGLADAVGSSGRLTLGTLSVC